MPKVCDCFPELKEITQARERRYRSHPDKAAPEGPQSFVEVKVASIGHINELVECRKSGFKFIISEPVHVGGQNVAPTPLEFLLAGAVGCYAAVFAFYAAKLDVSYERFEAVARTNMDVRGHMMADAPPSGFQTVTIDISIVSDAAPEKLKEIERLSLAGCPGINTLRHPVPVETRLTVRPAGQAAAEDRPNGGPVTVCGAQKAVVEHGHHAQSVRPVNDPAKPDANSDIISCAPLPSCSRNCC